MGVPAFFRWLSKKYASLVVHCVEQKGTTVDDVKVPVDTSEPNPNDTEFDNLYLDMNGIIHPCCHPEDKPAPKNEDEMMELIFEYIDRIFSIVRPRQLLYMAIDGVAPRAKMNQQRSRRFRASKESVEKREDVARIKEELRMKGCDVLPDKPASEHFDSNCITPGTPFMFRLADCLRYYVHDRLNNDPGWRNIKVILSDANVPGEGEHKIMDYIRRQRAQPDHNPNTHHCLCGADADLIMLGLATHEPNFTIIREEFKPNQPRPCDICGQMGHEMKECSGAPREKQGEHDELEKGLCQEQEFIFLRLCVLREYLTDELTITGLPFKQDIERAIDDWVFMCFFVGNDFLPHLPSLQIREGAIDRLIRLYKDVVLKTGGYLTENGFVNQSRVQLVLSELGGVEDEIFKTRRESDLQFKRRNKEKRKRTKMMSNSSAPKWMMQGSFAPQAPGGGRGGGGHGGSIRQEARDSRVAAMGGNQSNSDAAASLRSMLDKDGGQQGVKRKNTEDDDSDPEPEDDVKLWEDGWKGRYYQNKFAVSEEDTEFRHHVANEYVLGLCWVLQYYYQGCPSWKWYYPFHYAPFASDFVNIGDVDTSFEKDTEPFKPLEQLMGVFPAASKEFLPPTWQPLMEEPESAIIDFYPIDFRIDLNGKKYAWQGVALLPFVDEKRLWAALDSVYPDLTDAETKRNIRGSDRLFVGKHHASHAFIEGMYEGGISDQVVDLLTKDSQGMGGKLWCDTMAVMAGEEIPSPVPQLEAIHNNQALSVHYHDPEFEKGHVFSANILPGAKFPDKTLKPQDLAQMHRGGRGRGRGRGDYRPQLGFQRNSGYRGRGSFDSGPASRNIRAGLGSHSNVAPPLMAGRGSYGGSAPRGGGGGGYGASRGGYNDRRGSGGSGNYQQQGQRGRDSFSSYGGRGGGYGGGHHGGGGGGGSGGGWQQRNQTQSYQQNQQRGYQQGGYQQGGGYQQRGGGSSGGGYQSRDGGGYDSYSTRRGSGPHQQRYDRR